MASVSILTRSIFFCLCSWRSSDFCKSRLKAKNPKIIIKFAKPPKMQISQLLTIISLILLFPFCPSFQDYDDCEACGKCYDSGYSNILPCHFLSSKLNYSIHISAILIFIYIFLNTFISDGVSNESLRTT